MRRGAILLAFAATAVLCCSAESNPTARRDEAVRKIDACLRRNEVSSRQCKDLNRNIQFLVDVYRGGDKSVLPILLKFTYLTEFYDEALLNDPDGFLTALRQLSDKKRREVAIGIAGGYFGPVRKPEFSALRTLLTSVPESSPNKTVAQECLKELETNNASLFLNYFPPWTFTSRAADFQIFWYSRDLYALGEQPLWPIVPSGLTVYRFTHLGAFTGPKSTALTLLPGGTGMIRIKALSPGRDSVVMEDSRPVTVEQVRKFLDALNKADYWHVPTELPSLGLDGAEWILEAVQNGQYRVVLRWCPGTESHDPQVVAFAEAARFLLELAGQKHNGGC